jgi:hypothetical protein
MAWQRIDGEDVLLDIDGEELLGLNEVGARIWALCDGGHSVDDIAAELSREFDIDGATALADTRAFLDELLAMKAVIGYGRDEK